MDLVRHAVDARVRRLLLHPSVHREAHNGDKVSDDDKVPLRRRPAAEEVEPDTATPQAKSSPNPKPAKTKAAVEKRPRRATTGQAATGAPQKVRNIETFFKPAAAPQKAAGKKAAAPKGRAPPGQPHFPATHQQRFARAPEEAH